MGERKKTGTPARSLTVIHIVKGWRLLTGVGWWGTEILRSRVAVEGKREKVQSLHWDMWFGMAPPSRRRRQARSDW